MRMVSYTWDTLPPLTEQDRAELAALEDLPDGSVDDPDCPVLTNEQWAKRIPNPYCRPVRETSQKAGV